jgi:SecD/SecF fusion protein
MSTLLKSLIVGFVTAVIVFLLFDRLTGNRPLYKVHYTVKPSVAPVSATEMEDIFVRTAPALRQRMEKLGLTSMTFNKPKDRSFDLLIENVKDTTLTRQAIERNNKFEIREVFTLSELAGTIMSLAKTSEKLLSGEKKPVVDTTGEKLLSTDQVVSGKNTLQSLIAFSTDMDGSLLPSSWIGAVLKKDTAIVNKILSHPESVAILPGGLVFSYGPIDISSTGEGKDTVLYLYAIKTKNEEAELRNTDIENAVVDLSVNGTPQINFQFRPAASIRWKRITTDNVGRFLAIIVDGQVISAPKVLDPITGGNTSISGGFSPEEAEIMARLFNTGLLPFDLLISREEITGQALATGKKLLASALTLVVFTALTFLIFNSLKTKQKFVQTGITDAGNAI